MKNDAWQEWQQWCDEEKPGSYLLDRQDDYHSRFALLEAMKATPQDKIYHPEGDVWIHTCLCCDAAANIAKRENLSSMERQTLILAALCHDIGKSQTTEFIDGRWRSRLHAPLGARLSREFLEKIACPQDHIELIVPLVKEHLFFAGLPKVSRRVVRRLVQRLEPAKFSMLKMVIEADLSARPPLPLVMPEILSKIDCILEEMES